MTGVERGGVGNIFSDAIIYFLVRGGVENVVFPDVII